MRRELAHARFLWALVTAGHLIVSTTIYGANIQHGGNIPQVVAPATSSDIKSNRKCPTEIPKVIERDKGMLWGLDFGRPASQVCAQNPSPKISNAIKKLPYALEDFFENNPQTSLGLAKGWLRACLKNMKQADYNAAVVDFYLSEAKLNQAAKASIQALSATNTLLYLGRDLSVKGPNQDIVGPPLLPQAKQAAERLLSCPAPKHPGQKGYTADQDPLEKLVKSTLSRINEMRALANSRVFTAERKRYEELWKEMRWKEGTPMATLLLQCHGMNPLMDAANAITGLMGAKPFRCDHDDVKRALLAQLHENRPGIIEQMKPIHDAAKCLNGGNNCYRTGFFDRATRSVTGNQVVDPIDTIADSPALDAESFKADLDRYGGPMKEVARAIDDALKAGNCRIRERKAIEDRARMGTDLGVVAGMMAMGGAVGLGVRSIGNVLKFVKAARTAGAVSKTATLAGKAYDVAMTGAAFTSAQNACKNLQEVKLVEEAIRGNDNDNTCKTHPADLIAAVSKIDDCLMNVSGTVTGTAGPLLGMATKQATSKTGRMLAGHEPHGASSAPHPEAPVATRSTLQSPPETPLPAKTSTPAKEYRVIKTVDPADPKAPAPKGDINLPKAKVPFEKLKVQRKLSATANEFVTDDISRPLPKPVPSKKLADGYKKAISMDVDADDTGFIFLQSDNPHLKFFNDKLLNQTDADILENAWQHILFEELKNSEKYPFLTEEFLVGANFDSKLSTLIFDFKKVPPINLLSAVKNLKKAYEAASWKYLDWVRKNPRYSKRLKSAEGRIGTASQIHIPGLGRNHFDASVAAKTYREQRARIQMEQRHLPKGQPHRPKALAKLDGKRIVTERIPHAQDHMAELLAPLDNPETAILRQTEAGPSLTIKANAIIRQMISKHGDSPIEQIKDQFNLVFGNRWKKKMTDEQAQAAYNFYKSINILDNQPSVAAELAPISHSGDHVTMIAWDKANLGAGNQTDLQEEMLKVSRGKHHDYYKEAQRAAIRGPEKQTALLNKAKEILTEEITSRIPGVKPEDIVFAGDDGFIKIHGAKPSKEVIAEILQSYSKRMGEPVVDRFGISSTFYTNGTKVPEALRSTMDQTARGTEKTFRSFLLEPNKLPPTLARQIKKLNLDYPMGIEYTPRLGGGGIASLIVPSNVSKTEKSLLDEAFKYMLDHAPTKKYDEKTRKWIPQEQISWSSSYYKKPPLSRSTTESLRRNPIQRDISRSSASP